MKNYGVSDCRDNPAIGSKGEKWERINRRHLSAQWSLEHVVLLNRQDNNNNTIISLHKQCVSAKILIAHAKGCLCFGDMCKPTCIYCVLYCLYRVFVLICLCIFILIINCSILLLLLFTAIQFSVGGSSPYTVAERTNKNIHKQNNTKTRYKQYKTQYIQVGLHISPKHRHSLAYAIQIYANFALTQFLESNKMK